MNTVDILSNIYSLNTGDEWSNEAANVFGSNKASLQMEMIEENTVLKHQKQEVSCQEFWIKLVCANKYPELKKISLETSDFVWVNICL